MECINTNYDSKRCQEGRCAGCKLFSPDGGNDYEPLQEIDGLGIDH